MARIIDISSTNTTRRPDKKNAYAHRDRIDSGTAAAGPTILVVPAGSMPTKQRNRETTLIPLIVSSNVPGACTLRIWQYAFKENRHKQKCRATTMMVGSQSRRVSLWLRRVWLVGLSPLPPRPGARGRFLRSHASRESRTFSPYVFPVRFPLPTYVFPYPGARGAREPTRHEHDASTRDSSRIWHITG